VKELKVVKVIELMGESPNGWQEATENTLTETSKTVRNIVGLEVVGWTAKIERIRSYPTELMSRSRL